MTFMGVNTVIHWNAGYIIDTIFIYKISCSCKHEWSRSKYMERSPRYRSTLKRQEIGAQPKANNFVVYSGEMRELPIFSNSRPHIYLWLHPWVLPSLRRKRPLQENLVFLGNLLSLHKSLFPLLVLYFHKLALNLSFLLPPLYICMFKPLPF